MRYTPLLAVAWMAACSVEESTSVETSGLHAAGVVPDAGSPEANVVVRVRTYLPTGGSPWKCTGILITPRIVLTANHCFTGFAPEGSCHALATTADITIGNSIVVNTSSCPAATGYVCNPVYNSAAVLLRSGTENCQNDAASDVAIIYLQEAVTPASLVAKTIGGITVPAAPRIFEPDFLSPHHAMYGVAGYAVTNTRSYKEFLSDDIDNGTQDGQTVTKTYAKPKRLPRSAEVIREGGGSGRVTGVAGTLGPDAGAPAGAPAESQAAPRRFSVHANQVVLAAGALRSPAILQASAIDHPSIGRHLRIHPVPIIGALHEEPVDMWRGTMQAARSMQFGQDELGRRRYVIESAPGHLGLLALVLPWGGAAAHAELMARARHFSPLIAITRDGGEGRTRLTRAGRVRIDYRLDDEGRSTLRHALVSMARLARAGGAREILAVGVPLRRHVVDGAAREASRFAAFERDLAGTDFAPHRGTVASAHQMGTIRAGADPADHPADPRGRVRGDARGSIVAGLYVADTSTFPTGIGVNPMITVMALARRVSRTVLAEGGSASSR